MQEQIRRKKGKKNLKVIQAAVVSQRIMTEYVNGKCQHWIHDEV